MNVKSLFALIWLPWVVKQCESLKKWSFLIESTFTSIMLRGKNKHILQIVIMILVNKQKNDKTEKEDGEEKIIKTKNVEI